MSNTKIGSVAAIFLIVTIMINHIILDIPKIILDSTGSATPINIIYISILAILLTLLICKIFNKFPGADILGISEFLFGKWFKRIVGFLFIIYLLLSCSFYLRDFCEGLKIIYFRKTQIYFILALFAIVTAFCNLLGEKSIIRSNIVILPLGLISIAFIFLANIKNLVPSRMFPILGNGFNETFIAGTSNIFSYSCLALLLFLPPFLKDTKQLNKIAISSIIISAIYLFICLTGLLFMFAFMPKNHEILPIYLASRNVEFGTFFQRVDAVFLFVWILQISVYTNIVVMLIIRIFKDITNIENKHILVYPTCLLLFSFSLIAPNLSTVQFFEANILKNIIIYFVLIFCTIILILAYLKNLIKNKNKEEILID